MAIITEDYVAKLTKDYLIADSIHFLNRIINITRAILNIKNSI